MILKILNKICPGWVTEYKFHPSRRWRADYCNPECKIIIEQNGGVWTGGRHTSGSGFIKDMEKLNAATVLGYRILQYTPQQINKMEFILDIEQLIRR